MLATFAREVNRPPVSPLLHSQSAGSRCVDPNLLQDDLLTSDVTAWRHPAFSSPTACAPWELPLGRGTQKRGEACTSPERGPSLRDRGYPPPVILREDLARGVAQRQHAQALVRIGLAVGVGVGVAGYGPIA